MNFVRNYAIEAFRYYAIIGEPTEEEYIKSIRDRAKRQVVSVRNTLSVCIFSSRCEKVS